LHVEKGTYGFKATYADNASFEASASSAVKVKA